MPKLKLVRGGPPTFSLVYGMRLFPRGEVASLSSGTVAFEAGREGRITLHVIDGTRQQIKRQLLASVDAFFEIYGKDGLGV
jgi:hypothetical protein